MYQSCVPVLSYLRNADTFYSCLFIVSLFTSKKGQMRIVHLPPYSVYLASSLAIYPSIHPSKGIFFRPQLCFFRENLKDNAVGFIINLVNLKEKHNSNIAVSLVISTGYSQPIMRKAAAASTYKLFHPLSSVRAQTGT